MDCSLEVFYRKERIFCSHGKWLYPLFELEVLLENKQLDVQEIIVHDKIIGRAAALILMHLGVRVIHAEILSRPGMAILDLFNIDYVYNSLVDRVACKTEELLEGENDPKNAYQLLKKRANL